MIYDRPVQCDLSLDMTYTECLDSAGILPLIMSVSLNRFMRR